MIESKCYIDNVISGLKKIDFCQLESVITEFDIAIQNGKTIFVCGNGGSAATALHMQNDFNKSISAKSNNKIHVQCLNENIALITAIANDIDYSEIFYYQLQYLLEDGDLFIPISASGNSLNIIKAAKYAKLRKNKVIAFTGFDGGELAKISDYNINVPVCDMQITEDIHLVLNHLIMRLLCSKEIRKDT